MECSLLWSYHNIHRFSGTCLENLTVDCNNKRNKNHDIVRVQKLAAKLLVDYSDQKPDVGNEYITLSCLKMEATIDKAC